MLDYITKPTADAATDLTNAVEHLSVAEGGDIAVAAGTYDIYVRVAGTVTTGAVLTAANDGDEAEFFYTGDPGGNIGIDIQSGTYMGSYTTDYQGNPFTLADVQAAPVCLRKPVVAGNTSDGNVLTITPSLWIYDGPTIAPLTRRHRLDGVEVSPIAGGDQLTFTIDLAQHSAQVFTVAEAFGGTTVISDGVTIDTAVADFRANDTNAVVWYAPESIVLDGLNNLVGWNDNASDATGVWNVSSAPTNGALATWDNVNKKLTGNGSNQALMGGGGTDFNSDAGGYSIFCVADASTSSDRTGSMLFSWGYNQHIYFGLGRNTGGNLLVFVKDNSYAGGTGFGQDGPLPLNGTIPAGKHLFELRVTAETLVEVFIDGILRYSQAITSANAPGSGLALLALRQSGGQSTWFSNGAIYDLFITTSTGGILNNIRTEMLTAHGL